MNNKLEIGAGLTPSDCYIMYAFGTYGFNKDLHSFKLRYNLILWTYENEQRN